MHLYCTKGTLKRIEIFFLHNWIWTRLCLRLACSNQLSYMLLLLYRYLYSPMSTLSWRDGTFTVQKPLLNARLFDYNSNLPGGNSNPAKLATSSLVQSSFSNASNSLRSNVHSNERILCKRVRNGLNMSDISSEILQKSINTIHFSSYITLAQQVLYQMNTNKNTKITDKNRG